MFGEWISGIQVGFYALVIIMFIIMLMKLERLTTLLNEFLTKQPQISPGKANAVATQTPLGSTGLSEEEMAAVMAIVAKLVPTQKVASVKLVSK